MEDRLSYTKQYRKQHSKTRFSVNVCIISLVFNIYSGLKKKKKFSRHKWNSARLEVWKNNRKRGSLIQISLYNGKSDFQYRINEGLRWKPRRFSFSIFNNWVGQLRCSLYQKHVLLYLLIFTMSTTFSAKLSSDGCIRLDIKRSHFNFATLILIIIFNDLRQCINSFMVFIQNPITNQFFFQSTNYLFSDSNLHLTGLFEHFFLLGI